MIEAWTLGNFGISESSSLGSNVATPSFKESLTVCVNYIAYWFPLAVQMIAGTTHICAPNEVRVVSNEASAGCRSPTPLFQA